MFLLINEKFYMADFPFQAGHALIKDSHAYRTVFSKLFSNFHKISGKTEKKSDLE